MIAELRSRTSGSQSGFSLIEVLLSIVVSAALLVPVGSWMVMAMRTQGPTATRFTESAQARIANTYLSRDVASAELVRTGGFGVDPSCGTDPDDVVMLQMVDAQDDPVRTVYVTHDDGGTTSVWRRTCTVADTSTVTKNVKVLHDVDTTTPPTAECAPNGLQDCRQLTFTATLSGGAPIDVRATRRATLDPTFLGTAGNFTPYAKITEVSRSGLRPNFTVVLDSNTSGDLDGTITGHTWSVTGPGAVGQSESDTQVTLTFSVVGTYEVTLEVTDGTDTGTKVREIEVENQAPIAAATVTPGSGPVQGEGMATTFAFDASASSEPENDTPLTYDWDFGDGVDTTTSTTTGPTPSVQFLQTATLGDREVKVTVTDSLGASAVERVAIRLLLPDGSDPNPAGPIVIATDGEPGGEPVTVGAKAPRLGTVGPGRPDVTVDFTTSTAGPLTWELRRGATVIDSSTDAAYSHVFGASDAGDWTVALVPDGGAEVTRDVRLNAAPVAAFTAGAGGNAPVAVDFDSGGSSDDGAIVGYQWNFGFFDQWTSTAANPTQLFTHPGAYSVVLTVTDDDGAQTFTTAGASISGTLNAPATGAFAGNVYSWDPVPGADEYQVHLEVTDAPGCSSATGPFDLTITPSVSPSITTAYAGCAVTAKHRVRVSSSWGPYSSEVIRP